MKVNSLFHLSEANDGFAGYNMQSVCLRADKSARVKLYLLADNKSLGKNGIFTVRVKE
jgi:hypothetical protein